MKAPQEMYADICCDSVSLEEFMEWLNDQRFDSYQEGYSDGAHNMEYELEQGVK